MFSKVKGASVAPTPTGMSRMTKCNTARVGSNHLIFACLDPQLVEPVKLARNKEQSQLFSPVLALLVSAADRFSHVLYFNKPPRRDGGVPPCLRDLLPCHGLQINHRRGLYVAFDLAVAPIEFVLAFLVCALMPRNR